MNYTIITDPNALKDFIWYVLPDLAKDEQYYVSLLARKKYCVEGGVQVKSDKAMLKRFTSTKERLFSKIQQLECPIGAYVQDDGVVIPQEAIALYIHPNPRSFREVSLEAILHFAEVLKRRRQETANPHQEVLSLIEKAWSWKKWVMFDIDQKGDDILEKVSAALGDHRGCYNVLETRGGYYVMVQPGAVPTSASTTWHKALETLSDCHGDNMIPAPGTYQGGFTPKFIL